MAAARASERTGGVSASSAPTMTSAGDVDGRQVRAAVRPPGEGLEGARDALGCLGVGDGAGRVEGGRVPGRHQARHEVVEEGGGALARAPPRRRRDVRRRPRRCPARRGCRPAPARRPAPGWRATRARARSRRARGRTRPRGRRAPRAAMRAARASANASTVGGSGAGALPETGEVGRQDRARGGQRRPHRVPEAGSPAGRGAAAPASSGWDMSPRYAAGAPGGRDSVSAGTLPCQS